jgi:chemotaxis protein CheX
MESRYIDPFVTSTLDVFSKMLATEVALGTSQLEEGIESEEELIAVIGLSGSLRGAAVIIFPVNTALRIAGLALCCEKTEVDADVKDVVAEFTNMIAGGAKVHLSASDGPPITLGLPTVIQGKFSALSFQHHAEWKDLPFECALGAFTVRVSVEESPAVA